MRVIKCYRCGKDIPCSELFPLETITGMRLYWFKEDIHICDDCVRSLCEWFEEFKGKEGNTNESLQMR